MVHLGGWLKCTPFATSEATEKYYEDDLNTKKALTYWIFRFLITPQVLISKVIGDDRLWPQQKFRDHLQPFLQWIWTGRLGRVWKKEKHEESIIPQQGIPGLGPQATNPRQHTAGFPISKTHMKKNQFASDPEELRQFRDHRWKALGKERIQICCDYFCKINFWCLIFWNMWKQGPNKNTHDRFGFASSNTLHSSKVSGPSGVPRINIKLIFLVM